MAPQLKIHVDGVGSVFRTAERGVLHINVTATCATQADASSQAQKTTEMLTQQFRRFATKTDDGRPHPSAGITTFSASAMTSSSFIPSSLNPRLMVEESRKFTASATFQVVFRDLPLLAVTASDLAGVPHVSIARTEWRLTDATKAEMEPEARIKAMRNAVQIAEDYASVVGRRVMAVDIKDSPVQFPSAGNSMTGSRQMVQAQMQAQAVQQMQQMPQSAQAQAPAAIVEDGPSVQPGTITATSKISVQFVSAED
ncbi:hypothetical protein AB5N19_02707 [Seiridium cardinale]